MPKNLFYLQNSNNSQIIAMTGELQWPLLALSNLLTDIYEAAM